MSIEPFLPKHNLHRHHRPPIKTIIVVHRSTSVIYHYGGGASTALVTSTTIEQWGNTAVGVGDTIKLGAVATKWRRKWVWKIIIYNDYLFLCNPNPMPPYIVVHNIGDDKRWKHSGEPSNGRRCMWRHIIFCNREVSSPLAAKDEEQGTHAKRREKNQGGSSARRKGTFYLCCPLGWSLLLIIILVQRLSKKYSIITCCTYLFFAGILQGYSNREESTTNKEHFGMQKEGRIIKEDNQQGERYVLHVVLGWYLRC